MQPSGRPVQQSTKPLTPPYSSSRFSLRFYRHDQPFQFTLPTGGGNQPD